MTTFIVMTIWLSISLGFNYPVLLADSLAFNDGLKYTDDATKESWYKNDVNHCLIFALIPFAGIIVTLACTKFWKTGFRWR